MIGQQNILYIMKQRSGENKTNSDREQFNSRKLHGIEPNSPIHKRYFATRWWMTYMNALEVAAHSAAARAYFAKFIVELYFAM